MNDTSEEAKVLPISKRQSFSLSPSSLDEAMRFADLMSKSDIVPKDYKGKPGNVLVAVQMGAELGLAPMQALQNIAVINGRPCVWGDSLPALAKAHPKYEYLDETFDDSTMTATCRAKRKGEPEQTRKFSKADAEKANLWKKEGTWQTYPKRMLQMRARSWAVRDVFPDAMRGLSVAEEAMDIKDMGPADVVEREPIRQPQPKSAKEPEQPVNEAEPAAEVVTQSAKPTAEAPTGDKINASQTKLITAQLANRGIKPEALNGGFGVDRVEDLTLDQLNPVLQWIRSGD